MPFKKNQTNYKTQYTINKTKDYNNGACELLPRFMAFTLQYNYKMLRVLFSSKEMICQRASQIKQHI